MDKSLVGLSIPAISQQYDFFVLPSTVIGVLTGVLAKGVAELSDGRYQVSGKEMLILREPDMLLNPAMTLADYGVQDGAQLVML